MQNSVQIKRALISVSDKQHIQDFAKRLADFGVEILSTGGTAQLLQSAGIPVIEISDYTGFPEMMDGRLKTLHPKIFGGILGRREQDAQTMVTHNLPPIDLVVVNLYPFAQTVAKPNATLAMAIENIDIGGPSLIRAAAKNHAHCAVVTDIIDYDKLIEEIETSGGLSHETRFYLAKKAFSHTAHYDGVISNYLTALDSPSHTDDSNSTQTKSVFGETLNLQFIRKEILRYGENPHQQAALYLDPASTHGIGCAVQLQGKPLSYNNILDANAALSLIQRFSPPCCVIVKHNNPCGVACADNIDQAYEAAFQCDPQSAFGGIIACNKPISEQLITQIFASQFAEVIIAPAFSDAACEIARNKPNCRLLTYTPSETKANTVELKTIEGGILVQTTPYVQEPEFEIVTKHQPDPALLKDCQFAWEICKSVKSNAIVLAKDGQTIGIGAGQTSRVFSLEIACLRAEQNKFSTQGAVLASDAFLPFKDSVEIAHRAGIKAIIQTGGSVRDPEVIECANQLGIVMIVTHMRYFLH